MYKLFLDNTFYGTALDEKELKFLMDSAVRDGYSIDEFEVFQRKTHVTYMVSESKLVID